MTKEQMRVAMGKWFGFVKTVETFDYMGERGTVAVWKLWDNAGHVLCDGLPNYPESLDAMHEAEKHLTHGQALEFIRILKRIIPADYDRDVLLEWTCIHATALERCRAFGITKGLWKEGV